MKKGLAISLFLVISLLLIQSGNDLVQAKDGIDRGIKIAGYQFVLFDVAASPQPGLWEGTGNFDGSFTVSADGTKITNLSGSFETDLCGEIDVPGDLDPPAETAISNNEFSMLMNESGTLTFLSVSGTFTSDTTMEGDYGWGVDGCGLGGRLSIDAEFQGEDPPPTTEPPPATTEPPPATTEPPPTTEPTPTTEPSPGGKLVLSMVIQVETTNNANNAKPGQWVGSGAFEGTFNISEDSSRIMDLTGSFDTVICGEISVPGDLDPPAEIVISDNEFSILMEESGTINFLSIKGSFPFTTTLVADYGWGVDGCGAGGRIPMYADWYSDNNTEPLFETVLYMPKDTGYAYVPDNDSLDLGVGENDDFTIEAFFYVPDLNNDDTRVEVIARKQDSYTFYIDFDKDTPDWIFFELIAAGGGEIRLGVELDIFTGWHHAAVVFDNEYTEEIDMMAIFLDGNEVANSNDEQFQPDWTPGIPNSSRQLLVGNSGLYGYLEEMRLSSIVRYSGPTYTVPTEPFTTDADTRALWHFDETPGSTVFEDASSYNNDLIGEDGAQTYNP